MIPMDTPQNAPKPPGTESLEDYIEQHTRDQEAWRRFFDGIQNPNGFPGWRLGAIQQDRIKP